MFGGKIHSAHIQILHNRNALLVVFSNQLYIFDLNETQILQKYQLSKNLIKTWNFCEIQNKIQAVDEAGQLIQGIFQNKHKNKQSWFQNFTVKNKKITQSVIQDATIILNKQVKNSHKIFFIQQKSLFQYENSKKVAIAKNINKILYSSAQFIICQSKTPNIIQMISLSLNSKKFQQTYEHKNQIITATVQQNNIVFGDINGKIYILKDYLIAQKPLISKLEWHVHQVNCLVTDQQYLYSAGQEGTVVMWHLRQGKRDFLPRIGTEILNVYASEGIIFSILKDNSICAIDLNNDKMLKNYKTIIDSHGFSTKKVHQKDTQKKTIFKYSQSNNRNLIIASALPGSLQLINLNDGKNHQIELLPRNLISRLDQNYPQPHDVYDVCLNQDWTLLCCSTNGINHNYLHFYKNEGYNLQYNIISKVENPHKGPISILSFNNTFITYSQNQKIVRFWSKVRKSKRSIIEKQQEFFTCTGQINYRQKTIKNCYVLKEQNLLLINFHDQIVLINLKNREVFLAFKSKTFIVNAYIVKKTKNVKNIILVTKQKIVAYEINQNLKKLQNFKVVYYFQKENVSDFKFDKNSNGKLIFMIQYPTKQCLLQFDLIKYSTSEYFQNQNLKNASIMGICYSKNKILCLGSDSSIVNLSSEEQLVKLSSSRQASIYGMETEQDSGLHLSNETFQNMHKNYLERISTKKKGQVHQCVQKIQLQMYPNIGIGLTVLCDKMFI